jgi:hypothetical protein
MLVYSEREVGFVGKSQTCGNPAFTSEFDSWPTIRSLKTTAQLENDAPRDKRKRRLAHRKGGIKPRAWAQRLSPTKRSSA